MPEFVANNENTIPFDRIALGTWALGGGWGPQPEQQSLDVIWEALHRYCSLVDTAPLYGLGRAERYIAEVRQSISRPITVITKIPPLHYQWSPLPGTPISQVFPVDHILKQIHESRERLRQETLDIVLFQTWCPTWYREQEWYDTMLTLQDQGMIRQFGISVSDSRPDEANEIIQDGRVSIIEASYSILDQRADRLLFPLALDQHVHILARSPLASGALAEDGWNENTHFHRKDWRRKVFRGETLRDIIWRVSLVSALLPNTHTLGTMSLLFALSHPAVSTVIVGAQTTKHLHENFSCLHAPPLPQEVIDQLRALWVAEFSQNIRVSIGL